MMYGNNEIGNRLPIAEVVKIQIIRRFFIRSKLMEVKSFYLMN